MALWRAIISPWNVAEPAGSQDDICWWRCHKRAVGKGGPAPCRTASAFLTCEGIPVGEARLTVPIIQQILTPRRGTKRWPDARARADGSRWKRARNAARLTESAADDDGDDGKGVDGQKDDGKGVDRQGDDGKGVDTREDDGDMEDVCCPSTHAHTTVAVALELPARRP